MYSSSRWASIHGFNIHQHWPLFLFPSRLKLHLLIHWLKNVLNTVWQHKCSDGLILQFFPHWTIKFPVLLCQLTKFLFGFWALLQWISFQGDSDKCWYQSWGNEKHHWSHSWDRKILVQTYLIPLHTYDSWMNHIFTCSNQV